MNPLFQRLALLVGGECLDALERARVMVVGVGGVGGWTAEALARSGVGEIALVDSDAVCVTNINRQIQADISSIGKPKVEVLRDRLLSINPRCSVPLFEKKFSRENAEIFPIERMDYVIDAIDSITYKLDLIEICFEKGAPVFSSMGMAQKIDPTKLLTADIWETKGCPLARLVRQGLRKRGFSEKGGRFTVVYSAERLPVHSEIQTSCGSGLCLCPVKKNSADSPEWCASKKIINGSCVTVTATAGMILAGLVIQDIFKNIENIKSRKR
jgi:tRNA A37 threonylcarbamoyladenosine dehydratase